LSRSFGAEPIMNPFSSGTRLRDMIRAIRACKTAAEERAVIRKECAAIRAAISENDQEYRHRNLAKLMFIHMLGYPTHFGQMECLKLIASPGFPEKRIGYLGLMLLLDERQEVLMLVTNSIKQDLNHTNQYIVGLALCALGNICSAEMARDLAPEVERLLQFRDPNVRKKAALCTIRIIKKVPDLAENFVTPAVALLKEKHHGVLLTGVQLCTDLSKVSTEALEYFKKKSIDGLVKVLRDLANSPYSPEYDISGITDPFLHIRLLKFLRVLGQGDVDASDTMNDILAQVATKTEANKNAGNAILYECVATIMSIEDNGGLRVLAVNILGRFLSSRDNNIRYVALNMLMKAITLDSQAVQRHRVTILECVKDSDASIRKRALELVYLLVNENNVKSLTKELIDYLEVSEPEFKGDLTAKICSIVEKFSPEKIWYIDQMLKVLSEETLIRVAVLVHRRIRSALVERMPVLDEATFSGRRAGSVPAAVSTSQGDPPKIPNGVVKPTSAPLVDLLDLSSDDIQAPASSGGDFLQDLLGVDVSPATSQGANQTQKSGTDVLLDLLSIGTPPAQSSTSTLDILSSGQDNKNSVDVLGKLPTSPLAQASSPVGSSPVMDLLGGFGTSQSVPVTNGPTFPAIVAFEKQLLKMRLSSTDNLCTCVVWFWIFFNYTWIQLAATPFRQVVMDCLAEVTSFEQPARQVLFTFFGYVKLCFGFQKSLVMRVRINYKVNDKDVLEEGQISNFPRDL
ncbi:UNVERIFIED_CONTAM: AP-1 complex subunit gamma-2, partial [Sesamum calycinum]